MHPCTTCGGTSVNPIGYCTGCGTFRGAETGQPQQYGKPESGQPQYGQPQYGQPQYQQPQYQQPQYQQPQYPPPQYQQYQQPPPFQQPPRRSGTGLVVGIVVGVLVLLIGGGAAVALVVANGDDEPVDRPVTANTATPTASTTRNADACVIGTWVETESYYSMNIDGVAVNMLASGAVQRFRADGTGELDMTAGVVAKSVSGDKKIERTTNGKITFKYHPQEGKIYYTDVVGTGTSTVTVDGAARQPVPVSGSTDPDEYTCTDGIFVQKGATHRIQLKRQ